MCHFKHLVNFNSSSFFQSYFRVSFRGFLTFTALYVSRNTSVFLLTKGHSSIPWRVKNALLIDRHVPSSSQAFAQPLGIFAFLYSFLDATIPSLECRWHSLSWKFFTKNFHRNYFIIYQLKLNLRKFICAN